MLSGREGVRGWGSPGARTSPDATARPVCSARARAGCQGAWPDVRGVVQRGGRGFPAVAGQERRRGRAPRSHWPMRGGGRGPPCRVYIRMGCGRYGQSGGRAGVVFVFPCPDPCPGCGSGWRAASGAAWRPPTASPWAAPPARREVSAGPSRAGGWVRVEWVVVLCQAPVNTPKTLDRCLPEPPAHP